MAIKILLKVPVHHSVVDWDFPAVAGESLDPSTYVSPPSCLKCTGPNGYFANVPILCREANTLNQPQGEVRTWINCTSLAYQNWLIFRSQSVLGSTSFANQYYLQIQGLTAYFMRMVNNILKTIDTRGIVHAANTWEHWRVEFWNGFKPDGTPALAVNVYKEVTSVWVQQGATMYDTDNYFKDTGVARCGIGASMRDIQHWRFDDTEIWGL